jgi:Flp pilus assembly protein TadG
METNMTRRITKHRGSKIVSKSEAGQALVELALTLPLLVVILFGAVELSSVTYEAIELSNSARAAVQYGAQTLITAADTPGIKAAAQLDAIDLSASPNTANFTTSVSSSCVCSDGSNAASCTLASCPTSQLEQILTVQTSATFTPLVRIPSLPTQFTLHGYAYQRVLNN